MLAVRLGCAPKFDIICETKANACPKITSMPTKRAGRALPCANARAFGVTAQFVD